MSVIHRVTSTLAVTCVVDKVRLFQNVAEVTILINVRGKHRRSLPRVTHVAVFCLTYELEVEYVSIDVSFPKSY